MPPRLHSQTALPPELEAIAEAAGRRLRARAAHDSDDADAAERALMEAASAAMAARHPFAAIAEAERRGEEMARGQVRPDALKRVERTARRAREATAEHEQAIADAAALGLSTREVAAAASITHGTVRALVARLDQAQTPVGHHDGGSSSQMPGENGLQLGADAA